MTYKITFKHGEPRSILIRNVVAVDYYNGCLYVSDGQDTRTYGVAEIETAERVNDLAGDKDLVCEVCMKTAETMLVDAESVYCSTTCAAKEGKSI